MKECDPGFSLVSKVKLVKVLQKLSSIQLHDECKPSELRSIQEIMDQIFAFTRRIQFCPSIIDEFVYLQVSNRIFVLCYFINF